MAVLRMGLPGIAGAVRALFFSARRKKVELSRFSLASNFIIVPRATGSVYSIREVVFGGKLPIKEKKIITIDDLIEFELVQIKKRYALVQSIKGSEGYHVKATISDSDLKHDDLVGIFTESEFRGDTCGDYDFLNSVLPIDPSGKTIEVGKIEEVFRALNSVILAMIPAANLLYFIYNIDNGVRLINAYPHDKEGEEKMRSLIEEVKNLGDSFQEVVANMMFVSRITPDRF
jgi:hypothetical protein